jgi:hypothetical protein
MSFTTRARQQGGVTSPAMARAAAVAAEINRAQTPAPVGPVTRAPKKDDESLFDKNKDAQPKIDPLVDDKDDDDKDKPKKKKSAADDEGFVELQSAGSASTGDGGFKSMPGSLADPFDDNDDKGDTSAPNDTGKPKTPSGI